MRQDKPAVPEILAGADFQHAPVVDRAAGEIARSEEQQMPARRQAAGGDPHGAHVHGAVDDAAGQLKHAAAQGQNAAGIHRNDARVDDARRGVGKHKFRTVLQHFDAAAVFPAGAGAQVHHPVALLERAGGDLQHGVIGADQPGALQNEPAVIEGFCRYAG